MPRPAENHAMLIRREAVRLGFASVGFSPLRPQENAHGRLRNMITEKRNGEMHYLETRFPERADPGLLLPEVKTIVSAALSYYMPESRPPASGTARISRYAVIEDYHRVVRAKLESLLAFIRTLYGGELQAVIAVDSSPVLEKAWAEVSGIGRTGKNTLLITPSSGSYVFLGELLINREIQETPQTMPDLCGACRSCLESCPTGALVEPGKLDARKCISYLTVELKRDFTPEESLLVGNWLFGCDLCQEACPFNRFRKTAPEGVFTLKEELRALNPQDILNLTGSGFRRLFYGTPFYRIGLKRLKRNARAVMENLRKSAEAKKDQKTE
jgi:epoxyqueuosine reductase